MNKPDPTQPSGPPDSVLQMLRTDGLYLLAASPGPGLATPIWVHKGKAYSLKLDRELPLDGWNPNAVLDIRGPI